MAQHRPQKKSCATAQKKAQPRLLVAFFGAFRAARTKLHAGRGSPSDGSVSGGGPFPSAGCPSTAAVTTSPPEAGSFPSSSTGGPSSRSPPSLSEAAAVEGSFLSLGGGGGSFLSLGGGRGSFLSLGGGWGSVVVRLEKMNRFRLYFVPRCFHAHYDDLMTT